MLKLDTYDNKRNLFSVGIIGDRFRDYVRIVKHLPNSKYKAKEKLWVVGIHDFSLLEKDLHDKKLNTVVVSDELQQLVASYRNWLSKTKDLFSLEDTDLPDGLEDLLTMPLMKHQKVAVNAFLNQRQILLADQMGVGKTLPAIVAAQYLRKTGIIKSCLIVCTASIKTNWAREMEKFLKDPDFLIIEGGAEKRELLYQSNEFFKIVNYELLRRDVKDFLFDMQYDLLIADEIHRIRSYKTQQTKAVCKLGKNAKYKWGLTGTPVHNKLEDLFSIMRFINSDLLGDWFSFDFRYILHGYFGEIKGYQKVEEIRKKLEQVMLRRRKEDVLDSLPDKVYNNIYIELSKEQREFYNNCKEQAVKLFDEEKQERINAAIPLAQMTYAKEVCDSTELIDPTKKISTKIKELQNLITELMKEQRKVVIFSQWAKMAFIIQRELYPTRAVVLHGGLPTSGNIRQNLIDSFANDKDIPIFIATTAGGEGINLQCADVVIFFDLPFNPQVVAQMEDRLHRKGQTRAVNVIKLIAKDTVEERVCEILDTKQDLFDDLVETRNFLSTKQLLKLL